MDLARQAPLSMEFSKQESTGVGCHEGWTQLSNFTFTFPFHALEKEMATHSSILARRIPWTEEPGRLQTIGLKELNMTEGTEHACLHS